MTDPSLVSLVSVLSVERYGDGLTTLKRVTDMDGHKWPITGYKCNVCKWPLTPVNNSTTHPTCETENTK